jgi:hypothetical protein
MKTMHGLLEKVAHAGRADTDEHLDEVGARDREERHAGLTGNCACEERLTRTGRPVQEHALGDPCAERLELLRVLEELLDLLQFLDRFVDTGDVLEADLRRVGRHPLRARLAEGHDLRAAPLHLIHQEDPEAEEKDEGQQRGEDRPPRRRAGALRVERHFVVLHRPLQARDGLVARVVNGCGLLLLALVRELQLVLVRVEDDLLDLTALRTGLDLLDRLRIGDLLALGPVPAQGLQRQPDERRDDDERKKRATEKTVH